MKYEIKGGNMPFLVCELEAGEAMITEGGAMAWMSPNMDMVTEGGGGLGKAIGRLFAGEKIFRNIYTAQGKGMIAFAPTFPGEIVAVEITPDRPLILQKQSFLASTSGVKTEVCFNKKASSGLFGGEGFIMQKVSGSGTVFLEVDGSSCSYELAAGEKIIVDTGNLVCMDESCQIDIQTVKGVKNVLFGGEGLFNTVITGPGKVTVQSLSMKEVAMNLYAYMPHPSNSSN